MVAIQIIIPSYGRPADLRRCLVALQKQTMPDFEILCVCRIDDARTRKSLLEFQSQDHRIKEVIVESPGLVAAMNAGLRQAQAPFVTFTDDDSEAPSHWLATILAHFNSHPECGVVGGQDRLQLEDEAVRNPDPVEKVGTYSWTGKFHATHHCPIQKDFVKASILKGVNMTYRSDLIRGMKIGAGLKGSGAQVGSEQSLASRVLRQGKELHFVRDAWLIHYSAPRTENDDRLNMASQFALDTSYNYAYIFLRYQPLILAAVWLTRQALVGSKLIPGILRVLRYPSKWRIPLQHLPCLFAGARQGFKDRNQLE
jgi:GT2 family glycosyltransferase